MKAILCGSFGCKVVQYTEQQLEHAHQEHYPEHYQGKLPLTEQPATTPGCEPVPPCELPARGARSPNLVKIPSGTPREYCKDPKCGKAIWKVKHPKTGKPTPAACEPTVTLTDGTVVGTGAFPPYLDAAPGRDTLNIDGLGYSHFIDCPSSKAFRRS